MNYKKIITIILITSLLLVFGCTEQNSKSNSKGNGRGLEISFENYAPPKQVYDTDKIPIAINIRNNGEYAIPTNKLQLYLSGFDSNLIEGLEKIKQNEQEIDSKSDNFVYEQPFELGEGKIRYDVFNDKIPKINMNFKVDACFPYETNSWAQVCVNPELVNDNPKNPVCRPGSAKVYNTQGPVEITGVNERFMSYQNGYLKVKYDVTISNKGKGTVWDKEKYKYNCGETAVNKREERKALNRVDIKIKVPSGKNFFCEDGLDENKITLVGNSRTVTCIGEIKASSAYTTQVEFELTYGYSIDTKASTEIINSDI